MTIPSVHCEARLKGIAKKADKGGDWAQITLQVQPEDLPEGLWQAPLGSIWMVAFARVGDDGQPIKQETKPKTKVPFRTMPRCRQAGILCKDRVFQQWVNATGFPCTDEIEARRYVLKMCRINSRREIGDSLETGAIWDSLFRQFERETGRVAEARG